MGALDEEPSFQTCCHSKKKEKEKLKSKKKEMMYTDPIRKSKPKSGLWYRT